MAGLYRDETGLGNGMAGLYQDETGTGTELASLYRDETGTKTRMDDCGSGWTDRGTDTSGVPGLAPEPNRQGSGNSKKRDFDGKT
jgi:hypothetical protein